MNHFQIEVVAPQNVSPELLHQVATIHREEIPGGFLSRLPLPFLKKIYQAAVYSSAADLIVAIDGEKIGGFIAISYNTKQYYKDFCKRYFLPAAYVVAQKVLSWKSLYRMYETFKHGSKDPVIADIGKSGEILNFCVSHRCQRLGLGKKLFSKSVEQMQSHYIDTIEIITGKDQLSAHEFYKKNGATFIQTTEVHKGEQSSLFYYYLTKDSK